MRGILPLWAIAGKADSEIMHFSTGKHVPEAAAQPKTQKQTTLGQEIVVQYVAFQYIDILCDFLRG